MQELTYDRAYKLLKAFDPEINTHYQRIENPKGGEQYYVYDPQVKNKSKNLI
jgi:hypothetical protein